MRIAMKPDLAPCLLAAAIVIVGCARQESEAPEQDTTRQGDPVSGYLRATLESKEMATGVVGLTTIRAAIQVYQLQEGANPRSLHDLVSKGYLNQLPPEPAGQQYNYNPNSGQVELAAK